MKTISECDDDSVDLKDGGDGNDYDDNDIYLENGGDDDNGVDLVYSGDDDDDDSVDLEDSGGRLRHVLVAASYHRRLTSFSHAVA